MAPPTCGIALAGLSACSSSAAEVNDEVPGLASPARIDAASGEAVQSYEQAQRGGRGSAADEDGDATRGSAGDRIHSAAGRRPANVTHQVVGTATA